MDKKEKERYEWRYSSKIMKHYMFDNLTKTQLKYEDITNLLNQQDKRIKELEQENKKANINNYLEDYFLVEKENQQLRHQIRELKKEIDYLKFDNAELIDTINSYKTLNLQQQHDLPKKIVEEIKANNIYLNSSKPNQKDHIYDSYLIEAKTLNAILKKYENEIKKTP